MKVAGIALRIPEVEDLIIMKAVASRPKDMADIHNLLQLHPHADRARIRETVQAFAEALDSPELSDRLEPLLNERAAGPASAQDT